MYVFRIGADNFVVKTKPIGLSMKYTVKKTSTLIDTIMDIYKGISKQKAKQLLNYATITLDGSLIDNYPKKTIEAGQVLELSKDVKTEKRIALPTKNRPVSIYFEDNYYIVGLKPAGILSCHDQKQETTKSYHKVLEAFLFHRDEKKLRLWPVHRLDKEVEGLIIFAKSEEFQELMKDKWKDVSKKYLALTEGKPEPESGILENWLKEGTEQRVFVYQKEIDGSKLAKTEYTWLRKVKNYHLLELSLHTGRKNQIRAHLSSIGCPIAGDRKYGADASVNRQIRLSAYKLEFKHPVNQHQIVLEYVPSERFFNPSKTEDEKYKII
jgi:23S rRNA pseudouridine1911/1915/1917 synthase